jgi:hypothetical protein
MLYFKSSTFASFDIWFTELRPENGFEVRCLLPRGTVELLPLRRQPTRTERFSRVDSASARLTAPISPRAVQWPLEDVGSVHESSGQRFEGGQAERYMPRTSLRG